MRVGVWWIELSFCFNYSYKHRQISSINVVNFMTMDIRYQIRTLQICFICMSILSADGTIKMMAQ